MFTNKSCKDEIQNISLLYQNHILRYNNSIVALIYDTDSSRTEETILHIWCLVNDHIGSDPANMLVFKHVFKHEVLSPMGLITCLMLTTYISVCRIKVLVSQASVY